MKTLGLIQCIKPFFVQFINFLQIKLLINEYNHLIRNCYLELPSLNYNIKIAYGYTKFNFLIDKSFEDTFNRADSLMYINKRQLKEKHSK